MSIIKNIKKEVGMKRFFVIALALLLAVPAISYAGSASSRWDVMIGGYIKMDFGYSDQMRANRYAVPLRESKAREVAGDEYGNWFMTGIDTRLNMTIKGPDVWGMKTMGFIEGDFKGNGGTGTYNSQGNFRLRHAYIKLIDKNFEITFAGNTSSVFGTKTGEGQSLLGLYDSEDPGLSVGRVRVPQINVEYFTLNKDLAFLIGIFANVNTVGTNYATGRINSFTMGSTPFIHGRVRYSTDKCGKIGKDKLMLLVDGFYGTEKRAWDRTVAARTQVTPTSVAAKFDDDDVDSWGVHGSFVLPILPEKKGNKAGSLALSAYGFITQNPGYMVPYGINSGYNYGLPGGTLDASASYFRGGDFVANTIHGWGPQVYFYITNEFMVDLFYAEVKADQSKRYQNTAGQDTIEKIQQYGIVFSYDPNPALKFTLAWNYNKADYARKYPANGIGDEGKANVFRFGAYYFF